MACSTRYVYKQTPRACMAVLCLELCARPVNSAVTTFCLRGIWITLKWCWFLLNGMFAEYITQWINNVLRWWWPMFASGIDFSLFLKFYHTWKFSKCILFPENQKVCQVLLFGKFLCWRNWIIPILYGKQKNSVCSGCKWIKRQGVTCAKDNTSYSYYVKVMGVNFILIFLMFCI